ncbi:cache domain-containing sensor histidine kinase [Paenibacillus oryzisoli]|uniref:Uncharacterized protein n=1 Tax=Paenibacillus oryzisoli TaxID=1850517 RepID=A0A198A169_9BACL|nr:sensor histidine kinase [Paenibacillus oryzisoli]OAS14920.1 hypothetical protein A8708_05325 [Paenibacillus oryzisoli]
MSKITIRNQLFFLAASTFVLLVVIFLVFYSQNKNIIKQKNDEYTLNMISQLQHDISSYKNSMDNLLMNIAYNPDMQEFMLEKDYGKKYEISKKIGSVLNNARLMKDGIVDVIVVGNSGNFYSTFGGNEYVTKYQELFSASPFITGLKEVRYGSNIAGSQFFIAGLSIFAAYDPEFIGKQIGYCYLVIDAKEIAPISVPKIDGEEMKFYLIDRDHQLFSSNDMASGKDVAAFLQRAETYDGQSTTLLLNGERNIVHTERIPELGGTIVSAVPEKALFAEIKELRLNVFYLLLTAVFILSLPFTLIMNNLMKPIRQMAIFIKGIRTQQSVVPKENIQLEGYLEMTILSSKLNTMFNEIDSLTQILIQTNVQLYKVEIEKKHAELAFLQSQINPHFLYNTFEMIKGMASMKGVPEIKALVQDLSRIFRYSIKGAEEVCLQEELDMVSAYLRIQKARFKDRFDIQLEVSSDALKNLVPRMILQPIVENAIIHGLEPLTKKGLLHLTAEIDSLNRLIIRITDNGVGMNEATVASLNAARDGNQHIGIHNVANRITFMYGDEYGITIKSTETQGTEVIMQLPFKGEDYVQSPAS